MPGFQMPITIDQAMDYINNNYYVLPAFQRDFVWKAEQIEMLYSCPVCILMSYGMEKKNGITKASD